MELTLETIAILLSIVAFIVTLIGFFASLKFYLDGVKLQQAANDVLSEISNKTESIQTQVTGIFDKTLDAALEKREQVSEEFESIQEKIHNSANDILKKVKLDIDGLGNEKVEEISRAIKKEFNDITDQLQNARNSFESTVISMEVPDILRRSAVARKILNILSDNAIYAEAEMLKLRPSNQQLVKSRLKSLSNSGLISESIKNSKKLYKITNKGLEISHVPINR